MNAPTAESLAAQLGASHAAFRQLLDTHAELRPEWKNYGAKLGWSLKLLEKKRNLCFVIPHDGFFNVGFTLGDRAVTAALASDLPESLKAELRSARRYAEGRGLRIAVHHTSDLATVEQLLAIKRL